MKFCESLLIVSLLAFLKITGQEKCICKAYLEDLISYYDTELKDSEIDLQKEDLGALLFKNKEFYIGYIGNNKKRLKIGFSLIKKNTDDSLRYTVKGKTSVGKNEREFTGYITISNICSYTNFSYGIDNAMKTKVKDQGIIIIDFEFKENKKLSATGVFSGKAFVKWYLNQNNDFLYDDIENHSDAYANNQFIGNWTSYKTGKSSTIAWGQYRIPCAGDLDVGAAEFMPNEKYHKYGWEGYKP